MPRWQSLLSGRRSNKMCDVCRGCTTMADVRYCAMRISESAGRPFSEPRPFWRELGEQLARDTGGRRRSLCICPPWRVRGPLSLKGCPSRWCTCTHSDAHAAPQLYLRRLGGDHHIRPRTPHWAAPLQGEAGNICVWSRRAEQAPPPSRVEPSWTAAECHRRRAPLFCTPHSCSRWQPRARPPRSPAGQGRQAARRSTTTAPRR